MDSELRLGGNPRPAARRADAGAARRRGSDSSESDLAGEVRTAGPALRARRRRCRLGGSEQDVTVTAAACQGPDPTGEASKMTRTGRIAASGRGLQFFDDINTMSFTTLLSASLGRLSSQAINSMGYARIFVRAASNPGPPDYSFLMT